MRKQEQRNKKKTRHDKLQQVEPEQLNKKKFSHQVMQMQSLYGNRVVERTLKKMNHHRKESIDTPNSPEMNFLDPEIVPIYRSWNDEQISGMRLYLTRNQFYYNHRSKLPKKQTAQTIEVDKSVWLKDKTGKVDDEIDQSKNTLAPTSLTNKKTKNQDAKKYFTSLHSKSDVDSSQEIETSSPSTEVENLEHMYSKMIKHGRFSFIEAYPMILLALMKRKNSEKDNGNKPRKKSKLSRFSSGASNKI